MKACNGPCDQGRKACPTPDACEVPAQPLRSRLWRAIDAFFDHMTPRQFWVGYAALLTLSMLALHFARR